MDQQQATISPTIDGILAHNRAFVERRDFERYTTDKYPDKKLAIVSCMDTRLTALLLAALGLKNGDAKIIKVAGAEVAHPFGSVMRSLLIAVCELGVEDIMIVAHTNCGAQHMSGKEMVANMERLGVSAERRHGGEPPRHAAPRARDRLHHGFRHRRTHPGGMLEARFRRRAPLQTLSAQRHGIRAKTVSLGR